MALLGLGGGSAARGAEEAVVVQWYVMDYPPAYIVNGPEAGAGYQDKILDYFAARMTGFRVDRHSASLARLLSNLANGGGVCSGSLGRTPEREQHMIFSKPILYSLPTRLVVTAAQAGKVKALLEEDGKVHLEKLAHEGFREIGAVQGRTYGTGIDAFLESHHASVSNAARPELVFRMLARGRVDYSFSFPDEAGYYARVHMAADDASAFVTFPVAGLPEVQPSYFACSNDAVGQQVIAAVNAVIDREGKTMPWAQYYLAWLDKNAQKDVELAQGALPR